MLLYIYYTIYTFEIQNDMFVAEFEDDEWPANLGDPKRNSANMPFRNGNATETTTLKRFAVRKKTDSLVYNMGAMLAGMGMGFDIRLSNTSMLHPRLQSSASAGAGELEGRAGNRDAYLAAVRDSFLSPQGDTGPVPDNFPFSPGFSHHTYHGQQTRYRPSVNFDVPIRFTESDTGYCTQTTDTHTTPSSDNRTTPSVDSRTTPSLSGTSFSGGTPSPLPRGTKGSTSTDDYADEMALISLSPSTDKAFLQYQRQMSGDSGSVFETPRTTPKTTPQKYNVKFEEGINSGSSVPTATPPLHHERHASEDGSATPTALRPPPPRRSSSGVCTAAAEAPPERPVTLDIIPRPRPQGILKRTSPIHKSAGVTPTPSDSLSAGEDYVSSKSGPSPCPGSTPPHIDHQRTLLDIDMEGQKKDSTRPLPAAKSHSLQPTISELEREFLS